MLNSAIARIVDVCTRYAWVILVVAGLIAILSGYYTARNFKINTDIAKLISPNLPWRQREEAMTAAFPQSRERILAVVQAPTPELTSGATKALTQKLSQQPDQFRSVHQTGGGQFFERNAFLFLPTEELARTTRQLSQASPIIGALATDPSLRGLSQALSGSLGGLRRNQFSINDLTRPLNMFADGIETVLAGQPAHFSWMVLLKGRPAKASELRGLIDIWAVLDYGELEPGQKPTEAIRQTVKDLNLASDYEANVRLTGPVRIADEEFGTLKEGALLNGTVTMAVVIFILWLALRSGRIILAVFLSLLTGLAMTAAFGLMMVSALNPISIAFAVLFIGLGVDFGIQYSVRYRAERHDDNRLRPALIAAGRRAGAPLTLAAAATAAGFFSFLPTDYRGLSELGLIAGSGMVIAFVTSITLLPALMQLLNPPGETESLGFKWLAPVDRFLERYRIPVIVITGLIVVGGLPLLFWMRFDFNPLNLRSPKVESIATYLDLQSDPDVNSNTAQVLAPSLPQAKQIAARLSALPQAARVVTLESFVPDKQQEKLALIGGAAKLLNPALNPANVRPAPTDAERVRALAAAASALSRVAGEDSSPGALAAKRLADDLTKLANADAAARMQAEAMLVRPLKIDLDVLREALAAKPVTLDQLPDDLVRDWITPEGRTQAVVTPKGDPSDTENLRNFARAVLAVEPSATGPAVGYLESGQTVVRAFLEAGFWALLSIAILLWIVLRRLGDVFLTLIPLLLAGALTLEICVLIDLPLNFANIIALPLLLGVGVAFKIYYVMAWRAGQTSLLQSSLTRAVIFSAATTATAFGSLWFSSHPGTSSMGKLLALSLMCTLAAAVLFQPALMGRPRVIKA